MNNLTYVVTAFDRNGQWRALNECLKIYSTYNPKILDHIRFVIVDDCCPHPVHLDEDYDLNLTLLHIDTDIPWNQGGARNLGVHHANTNRLLLTDMDFMFPEKTLHNAMTSGLKKHEIRRFKRTTYISGTGSAPHNIFLMHKEQFMKVGGVDEIFAGHYGYEDVFFMQQQKKAKALFTLSDDCCLLLVYKEEEGKAGDPSVSRDKSHNKSILDNQKKHSGLFLHFDWSVILEKTRTTAAQGV